MSILTTRRTAYADEAHPSDATRLPAGFDDDKSDFWANESLRPHWEWTTKDEQDMLTDHDLSKETIVMVATSRQERRAGAPKFVPTSVVPAASDENLSLLRHDLATKKATRRRNAAKRAEQVARRVERLDRCAMCGKTVAPRTGDSTDIAAVKPRPVLTSDGMRTVRCCGKCLITSEAITLEDARAEVLDDGRTRERAVREWRA